MSKINTCKYCQKTHTEMQRVYGNLLVILRKDLATTKNAAKKRRVQNGIAVITARLEETDPQRPCRYKGAA